MRKTYVVIGMGIFGKAVAARLYELGAEVLALDDDAENVQKMETLVTYAAAADARDEDVLRSLGVQNYDCAVVCVGDLAASVVITLTLKELGVPEILCKCDDEMQKKALEKVGADRAFIPEKEMGVKLAQSLDFNGILDFIELTEDYSIAEVRVPEKWRGKSIRELNIRAKYGINIIAMKDSGKIDPTPDPDLPLADGMTLVVLGKNERLMGLK